MAEVSGYRGELIVDHPLWRYTSWRVGGAAQRFYRPVDLQDLQLFLAQLPAQESLLWLGLGSNLLIRDCGVSGTVIATLGCLKALAMIDKNTVRAEAGVTSAKLAKFCAKHGFEDGAFFAGIPGTVGGALAMNAGAFGGETWRNVIAVETLDAQGKLSLRSPADYAIGYRSVKGPEREWFVAGHFAFSAGDTHASSQAIRDLLRKRAQTQPIGSLNCGSVFRNPPGDHAARLIEAAGLKGLRRGGAVVSTKHANFILNEAQASAQDIEQLIEEVAERVKKTQGVSLIREVRIVGG